MQPLVVEVPLHQLHHRPVEQQAPRLGVVAQPALDRVARGRRPDPHVIRAVGAKPVAQPALDRVHRAPACQVARRKAPDLLLAPLVVVPKLDAATVLERHEHPALGRRPPEAVTLEVELAHHQRMQQAHHVCAGRHAHAGPRLVQRARAPDLLPRLEHQHPAPSARQIGRTREPVVPRPDHDHVPPPSGQRAHRLGQPDPPEHGGGGALRGWMIQATASLSGILSEAKDRVGSTSEPLASLACLSRSFASLRMTRKNVSLIGCVGRWTQGG